MTLLDAQGNPLQPTVGGEVVDQIEELVTLFDRDPANWEKLEEQFHGQLKVARLHAPGVVNVALGQESLDLSNKAGQALLRLLADITVKALILKAREDRIVPGNVIQMPKKDDPCPAGECDAPCNCPENPEDR